MGPLAPAKLIAMTTSAESLRGAGPGDNLNR